LRKDAVITEANPIQGSINKLLSDRDHTRLFTICYNETFIKVLECESLKNLFTIRFPKEISCFDISADMNRYAVGYTDGQIAIKTRKQVDEEENIIDQEERDIELLE
jgi:hypothetical protein